MKKVELLAPAGSLAALKGAINAGADAVYLGGDRYGARAYAENFTQDEIDTGIRLAHAFGRKVYLTVNTLVKEKELDALYHFLLPAYECGLDGVIVQDLGVLRFIRRYFPKLSLHGSTQMTITGSYGAAFLQKEGVSRIVPARELSLAEVIKIKEQTGIEIESFIHGAMCYCYSGQCLFSSILGGRSGNRGRCAQPCRLPYRIDEQKSCYPLSMRDMCTLSLLPELIEAGIDSFKIEGRMKKPAYAAGVTAIYRKYIDLYFQDRSAYYVEDTDLEQLKSLYIRSQTGEGYYHRQNGRELLTLDSPAYCPVDEVLLKELDERYVKPSLVMGAEAVLELCVGEKARLTLTGGKTAAAIVGDVVQPAKSQPLSDEKIQTQILKSGNTLIQIDKVEIKRGDSTGIFLPVSALNQLRRNAVDALTEKLISANSPARSVGGSNTDGQRMKKESENKAVFHHPSRDAGEIGIHVYVRTIDQLSAALKKNADRIYVDHSLIMDQERTALEMLSGRQEGTELYLAGPYIVRLKDQAVLEKLAKLLKESCFQGILIRNLESLAYFEKQGILTDYVADANLYVWNRDSYDVLAAHVSEFYLPQECNLREWKEMLGKCNNKMKASVLVYGRLPMMITAGCLEKTSRSCKKRSGVNILTDRYGKCFPVYHDCLCCYSIIYNSVPLSLHSIFDDAPNLAARCRLDLTIEKGEEAEWLIDYYQAIAGGRREPAKGEYTTGHYKRGVE